MRSFSSAAAFSVKVNATTLRGSTPGCAGSFAMRWEMTWVLPEPGTGDDLQRLVQARDGLSLGTVCRSGICSRAVRPRRPS